MKHFPKMSHRNIFYLGFFSTLLLKHDELLVASKNTEQDKISKTARKTSFLRRIVIANNDTETILSEEECPLKAVEPNSVCNLSDSSKICKWDDMECSCDEDGTWLCLIPDNDMIPDNDKEEECPLKAVQPSSICNLSDSSKVCKWDDLECTCTEDGTWLCLIPNNDKEEECPLKAVQPSSVCKLSDSSKVCKWDDLECTCDEDETWLCSIPANDKGTSSSQSNFHHSLLLLSINSLAIIVFMI